MITLLLACAASPLLVIVTDTTRADLGGAPWPAWATPSTGAAVYTDAVSPSSWTGTSTAALLTGDTQSWSATLDPIWMPDDAAGDCWADLLLSDNIWAAKATRTACGIDTGHLVGDHEAFPVARMAMVIDAGRRAMRQGESPLVVQPLTAHGPVHGMDLRDVAAPDECAADAYRSAILDVLPQVGDLVADAVADGWTVVWTSDHGEAMGPDRWGHGLDLEDDQIRVPLAVWGPGVVPGWDGTPVSTLCIADLARGDSGLLTGGCDRPVVSAMIVDGEWVERGDL